MADTLLLPELSFTSSLDDMLGYGGDHSGAGFQFVPGETYTVRFDGKTYECTAQDASAVMDGYVFVGNGSIAGLPGHNEPFGCITYPDWDGVVFVCLDDTEPTEHTVAIYKTDAADFSLIFSEDGMTPTFDEEVGASTVLRDQTLNLSVGKQYKVLMNGQVFYPLTAEYYIPEAEIKQIYIGNPAIAYEDREDNGIPVLIGEIVGANTMAVRIRGDIATCDIAIYQYNGAADDGGGDDAGGDTEEEPQEGIVLKDRNGNDVAYYGIETVTFDTTTEGKQQVFTKGEAVEGLKIVPDFSGGDMAVNAPAGALVKSAVVKQPEGLTPGNIRNGAEVAGVTGDFIGDTETAEVALSMAGGDQVITPSAEGKVISQVTVKKPETLVPENIADGVEIGGVVGTLAAGGGGGMAAVIFINTRIEAKTQNSSSAITVYATSTIPENATVVGALGAVGSNLSSSTTITTGTTYRQRHSDGFIQATTGHQLQVAATSSPYSSYRYLLAVAGAIVMFTLPGFYWDVDENGVCIIYADETASELPSNAYPAINIEGVLDKVDLSKSKIETIPQNAFLNNGSAREILLPATVTSFGYCSVKSAYLEVLDLSLVTAVPALDQYAFGTGASENIPEIRVPAALYDEFVAATYWSKYASKIVAV